MITTVSYWVRLAVLVLLLATVAGVDVLRHGRSSTRWKEYLFIVAGGLAAGLFGTANDLVTSTLSADYFVFGKGLPMATLRPSAAILGFQAGFSAGAVASAVCLYVATRTAACGSLPLRKLLLLCWRPFALALAFAAVFPVLFSRFDPLDFTATLHGLIESDRIADFLTVWWIHLGIYTGLVTGVVWLCVKISRTRRKKGHH